MIKVIYNIVTCSETLYGNWYALSHRIRARVDEGSSLENLSMSLSIQTTSDWYSVLYKFEENVVFFILL